MLYVINRKGKGVPNLGPSIYQNQGYIAWTLDGSKFLVYIP